jgi:cyclophilin family peptidyl-prolyl cis-trans isomerase
MIQGGDISLSPTTSNSNSNPLPFPIPKGGTSIYHPTPLQQEIHLPSLRHNTRGILSMASRKSPSGTRNADGTVEEVNGSQFFVTFAGAPHLDGKSTVFGKVLEGGEEDTLTRLEKARVKVDKKGRVVQPKDGGGGDEDGEAVRLERVTIHANPFAGA